MTRRIHRNLHNLSPWGWPLTGPDAIALRHPVAGRLPLPDGRVLLVAEGERCEMLLPVQPGEPVFVWPENVIEEAD